MKSPVYVAGVAMVDAEDLEAQGLEELVFASASTALGNAAVSRQDIEGVCLAGRDGMDGRAISSMHMAGPAGSYLRDEIKVEDDGSLAFALGAMRIAAGTCSTVLVVSWGKSTESQPDKIYEIDAEPIYARPVGLNHWTEEAMLTQRFLNETRLEPNLVAGLADKHGGGKTDRTTSPYPPPIHNSHVPPLTDAAVAVVLTTQPTECEVLGMASSYAKRAVVDRGDPVAETSRIAQRAYDEADFSPSATTPVQTTDYTLFRRLMAAKALLDPQSPSLDSAVLDRVNADGGLWRRNPGCAAGLERIATGYECVRTGSEPAVSHAAFGHAGQGNFVCVL